MSDTIQITIVVEQQQVKDQLIAQLGLFNFTGFEETENQLEAFINADDFIEPDLENILNLYHLTYIKSIIKEQNWNALWESNFDPVIVDDFCVIRAHFHKPFSNIEYDIEITPKMSFGTGHHATTFMMISEMRKLDFNGKKVADFGTGTGVLAILAEKLGAEYVWAIDIDDWSIENATENIEKNNCKNIKIEKADHFESELPFDIILANINRNVILSHADQLFRNTKIGGQLLLSGLLKEDEKDILEAFVTKGFTHISTVEKNNWICLLLNHLPEKSIVAHLS